MPSGADQLFSGVATNGLVLIDEDAGLLAPALSDAGSTWLEQGLLEVRVRCNWGGRCSLTVEGLGALRYGASRRFHVGRFFVSADGFETEPSESFPYALRLAEAEQTISLSLVLQ